MSKSDADLFGGPSYLDGRLVVAAEILDGLERGVPKRVGFSGRPDEHVFQLLVNDKTHNPFPGTLTAIDDPGCAQNTALGCEDDQARLFVKWSDIEAGNTAPRALAANALGLVKTQNGWRSIRVEIIPVRQELFSRFGGLLETDALADSRVAIFGHGSGGSNIAIDLAKSGVGKFSLVDHDRLEVCNVARHYCDLSDIGRLKVQAMADAIRRKNPYAEVSVWPIKAKWDNFKTVREIVRDVDLVFAATDSHASKLLINKACFQEGRTCIFAGAHRRAHGGQVLRGQTRPIRLFTVLRHAVAGSGPGPRNIFRRTSRGFGLY